MRINNIIEQQQICSNPNKHLWVRVRVRVRVTTNTVPVKTFGNISVRIMAE
jgi:hypothetical protein